MHTVKQIAKARTLAAKLAASADPARNDNEAERAVALAKLIELCAKYAFELSDFVKPVASPEAPEQPEAAQPQPEAQPEAAPSKADADAARAAANRATVAKHYNGPSLAAHAKRPPALAEALARVATPVQRAKSASTRDCSGLALAETLADANGTFCPVSGTFDLGVLSRLASLGYLTVAGERIKLSDAARELARNTLKKAA